MCGVRVRNRQVSITEPGTHRRDLVALLLDRTSEVEVTRDANGRAVGRLNRVHGDGSGAPLTEVELKGRR